MKKVEKFITRDIAGEHVMMPIGKTAAKFSGMITANDVAAFIWDKLEECDTVEELTELVCEEFEVEREAAYADTKELIEQMKAAGWIK